MNSKAGLKTPIISIGTSLSSLSIMACMLVYVLLFTSLVLCVSAHPQCTDDFPPFEFEETNMFCDHYREFGCCDVKKDRSIEELLTNIKSHLQDNGMGECVGLFKHILCQECSPFAAHAFDTEQGGQKKAFAGMCRGFCEKLYNNCSQAIHLVTQDEEILSSLDSVDKFCDVTSLLDVVYCYPDIRENNDLNAEINRTTTTEEGCICLREYASDLNNPVIIAASDDVNSSNILYIGTQMGVVYAYDNGVRLTEPLLNISDRVVVTERIGEERGLIGFAFHPNYRQTQKLYVHYVRINEQEEMFSRISEFSTVSGNLHQVDHTTERVLLDIPQARPNHNGGTVLFGIDGYLYIFMGDEGGAWDTLRNGQDKSTLLSAVLRIDVDNNNINQSYSIPSDNPFIGEEGTLPEIFAYGVRNPFRASVDRGDPVTGYGKGRIFTGDVGQNMWETVDIIKKGKNYGWAIVEGPRCAMRRGVTNCSLFGPFEPFIHTYNHTVGSAVIGGYVYRGCNSPNFNGMYIYGDYTTGWMARLIETEEDSNVWENKELTLCGSDVCFNTLTNAYGKHILTFGEDFDGEVYVASTDYAGALGKQGRVGKIFQLVDPRRRGDPDICRASRPNTVTPPSTTQPGMFGP